MCGRFTQKYTWHEIRDLYELVGDARNLQAHYNIAPTDTVEVVRLGDSGAAEIVHETRRRRAEADLDAPEQPRRRRDVRKVYSAGGFADVIDDREEISGRIIAAWTNSIATFTLGSITSAEPRDIIQNVKSL